MRTPILFLFVAASVALPAEMRAAESCVSCHPDVRTEYERSVHARAYSCTDCHGGDASIVGLEAHAAGKGFRGKVERAAIPAMCGSCHGDADRMRASGLPTDQYAQYQKSKHGLLLAKGDTKVAVCTDCHSAHAIVPRGEPSSPVAPRNVAATCGRCHANAQLMGGYNLPADQMEKFRASVHGVALLVDEHPSAPNCATCHGAHGASDAIGITAACGHCHSRTRELFAAGPHNRAVEQGKMSECISCHGDHDVARPDNFSFDTMCANCHAQDSPARAAGEKLKTLLSQAAASVETTERELEQAARHAPTVTRYRGRLRQARAYLMEAIPVQHSLDVQRVEDLTRSSRSLADEVRAAVHGAGREQRDRRLLLAGVWVGILTAVAILVQYRRELRRCAPPSAATGSGG